MQDDKDVLEYVNEGIEKEKMPTWKAIAFGMIIGVFLTRLMC